MKTRAYFLLFSLYLISWSLQGQISIGIQGGLGRAWEAYGEVGLPEDAEIDVPGYTVSGLIYHQFNTYLRMGLEPGYTQRGAACVPGWNTEPDPIFNGDTKLFLRYIEMPLMLEGAVPFWKNRLAVFGKAGFGGAFLASAYEEVINFSDEIPEPDRRKIDLKTNERLNRIDYGLYGSAGIRYQFKAQQLFVSFNHYRGLHDADKNNKSLNRDLGLRLGWMMSL